MTFDNRPIGVFDSGVGGLTVVKRLREKLPNEDIIYFGDTARVPYGNKSVDVIKRFSIEIAEFLQIQDVKLIVTACNTASALALSHLRRNTVLPVIGVIDPGVRAALKLSRTGKIGVIGTRATIKSDAYGSRIRELRADSEVISVACPLLVPLVEENLLAGPITRSILEMYLGNLKTVSVETLILACTHYPLLKQAISEVIGTGTELIDSASETAIEVAEVLEARRISGSTEREGNLKLFVSDSPENFARVGCNFLGRPMHQVNLETLRN